jgi:hypothetical protein
MADRLVWVAAARAACSKYNLMVRSTLKAHILSPPGILQDPVGDRA